MIAFDGVWIAVILSVLFAGIALRPMGDNYLHQTTMVRTLWLLPIALVWVVYLLLRAGGGV
jgi:hypothetical protein